jgi:pimeloyl-ACP methyl ester carboxylesterase
VVRLSHHVRPSRRSWAGQAPGSSRSHPTTAFLRSTSPAGAAAALRGRGRRPDYRPLLAALDIPAIVVAGTADPWSTAEVTAEIVASLKRPELVIVDGCGHLPNLEAEARFNEALTAFLNQHAPGRQPGDLRDIELCPHPKLQPQLEGLKNK